MLEIARNGTRIPGSEWSDLAYAWYAMADGKGQSGVAPPNWEKMTALVSIIRGFLRENIFSSDGRPGEGGKDSSAGRCERRRVSTFRPRALL